MDLPAVLLAHLQDLTASIGQDDLELDEVIAALNAALRSTAASYCGFQLTIVANQVNNQWPVTLTAFSKSDDVPVATSLRLPLTLISEAVDPESRVTFFAVTPGAFTDLAADLSCALGGIPVEQQSPAACSADGAHTRLDGPRNSIELDNDLPLVWPVSGLTGLADLTVLNRAIGMLVDHGHDLAEAHQVLHRDAAAARVAPHIYAAWMLRNGYGP